MGEETSNTPLLSRQFTQALVMAAEWHAAQRRKKDDRIVPYISHLLTVASFILEDDGTEEEAIAGLLHDAVEDQGIHPETIEALFGAEVRRIVEACSDAAGRLGDTKPDWLPRKIEHIAKLRALGPDEPVLRVTAADKLHNCRDTVADLRELGPDRDPEARCELARERLDRFNGRVAGTCWYYGEMSLMLDDQLPKSRLVSGLHDAARALHQAVKVPFPAPQPPLSE